MKTTQQPVVALLGRRDEPTDAVEEYCRYLGAALVAQGVLFDLKRVRWPDVGWPAALAELRRAARSWHDTNVLVQYTALAWSEHGFSSRFLRVLETLRVSGARITVVFHDAEPFSGSRIVDRVRRIVQTYVMRRALRFADRAVFPVDLETISWLNSMAPNACFIPIGPNLSIRKTDSPVRSDQANRRTRLPSIAVFTITGGNAGREETETIVDSVRYVAEQIGAIQLSVFGRGVEARETAIRDGLKGVPVELRLEGLLQPPQIQERLANSDILLFIRGAISSRRGSALAGVACGLPIVAYKGKETAAPITEAGLLLVPYAQAPDARQRQLNEALLRLLSDDRFRRELAERSRRAFELHFCWDSIAAQFRRLIDSMPTD